MFRTKSAVAAVAVACLAFPATLLATPAVAASPAGATKISKVAVFSDRDEDEDEHESDHHEGHHQIPPVVIRPHHGDEDEHGEHEDDDEGWGASEDDENESDDDDGFTLPGPVPSPGAIAPLPGESLNPANPTGASLNGNTYSVNPLDAAGPQGTTPGQPPIPASRGMNPEAAPPVAIQQVRGPQRTPADVFMESATFGLLAVGAGAVALGGVAGVRAIKLRRNPKGDYFYGDN